MRNGQLRQMRRARLARVGVGAAACDGERGARIAAGVGSGAEAAVFARREREWEGAGAHKRARVL